MTTNLAALRVPGGVPAARAGQALMVAGGLLLATVGVFLERAGQPPLAAVWFRCVFGGLALTAWGAWRGRLRELRLAPRACGAALAAGLLMILNWSLFFAAIERCPIGLATVVFHVQPLWVIALAALLLRERISRRQVLAAVVALAGLAMASGLLDTAGAWAPGYAAGLALCLGGSLSYAGVTLIARATAARVSSFALAWWQCAVGVVMLGWWPVVHGLPAAGPAWGWLAGLGLLHTGLAYVLLYAGMARLPAAQVAVLQFVYPAGAVLMDWLVYGRALDGLQLAGIGLMGAALLSLRRR